MLPVQAVEERLSFAHVRAVAAKAGVCVYGPDLDFGIDGIFRPLAVRGSRLFPTPIALDFQLKASTQWESQPEHIVYDLEVKTYNDLIQRRLDGGAIPCILLFKALPRDQSQWLTFPDSGLFLGGDCYWEYLQGEPSSNKKTVRIFISKEQKLTPESLFRLLDSLKSGKWPC